MEIQAHAASIHHTTRAIETRINDNTANRKSPPFPPPPKKKKTFTLYRLCISDINKLKTAVSNANYQNRKCFA
jgi:hypothetical protein